MATQAGCTLQDQNLNIHSAGAFASMLDGSRTAKKGAFSGRKALNDISNSSKLSALDASMLDGSRTAKKGAFSGRKALNDISNSSKLSALDASRGQKSSNFVSKGKDFGATGSVLRDGDKSYNSKVPVKGQSSGRKPLGDLTNTNSGRPSTQRVPKKVQDKKLSDIIEETFPSAIKEEQFLHNHEECIKAERKEGMHLKYFLETVGLSSPPLVPRAPKLRAGSPLKNMEMKEMPDLTEEERSWMAQLSVSSPSRHSPRAIRTNIEIADETVFELIDSPKLRKNELI